MNDKVSGFLIFSCHFYDSVYCLEGWLFKILTPEYETPFQRQGKLTIGKYK